MTKESQEGDTHQEYPDFKGAAENSRDRSLIAQTQEDQTVLMLYKLKLHDTSWTSCINQIWSS
eukprot:6131385-Ditylum_brightwellii.AAC.1